MFSTVLVPLDGSERAERALPYAIHFATERGGRLVLVRAALEPAPTGMTWEERPQISALDEASAYLGDVAKKIPSDVSVSTAPLYGRPAEEILAAVDHFQTDSIVMVTHGRTGPAHLLFGSVAEAVLAKSSVPVFVIDARPGKAEGPTFELSSARILVPLDGSTFAESALATALDIVGDQGELVLSTVVTAPDHVERDETGRARAYLDQQEEASMREAFAYLHSIEARLRQQRPDLHMVLDVRVGDPSLGITSAARGRYTDLVVTTTHGRTGLRRAMQGSVAGAVLTTGTAPILFISPPAMAAAETRPDSRAMAGSFRV